MTDLREAAFRYMPGLTREPHTGNKWIVTLPAEYSNAKAIMKTSETAAMMTSAVDGNADAELIGIEREIDSSVTKILAVMKTDDGLIRYYLLDRLMVINRLKSNHQKWLNYKGGSAGENTTRVLYFRDYKLPKQAPWAAIMEEWSKYLVLTVDQSTVNDESMTPRGVVKDAKAMIAKAYGVATSHVEINIRL